MSSYEDADTASDKEAYGNKAEKRLHMVAHTYSPGILRTWGAEAGGFPGVQEQPK